MNHDEMNVIQAEAIPAIAAKPQTPMTLDREPEAVLMEAQRAAAALKRVLDAKPDKVTMNGQQYLEFEDWQTLGRFYGLTAKEDGDPELVNLPNGISGFKASAVVIDGAGIVRSRATAFCLSDEDKWGSRTKYAWCYVTRSGGHSVDDPGTDEIVWEPNPAKPGKKRPKKERIAIGEEKVPLFQLSSMAQTRANAKALRNVLSWVVVLAGYKPTPAEEISNFGKPADSGEDTATEKAPQYTKATGWEAERTDSAADPQQKPKPKSRTVQPARELPAQLVRLQRLLKTLRERDPQFDEPALMRKYFPLKDRQLQPITLGEMLRIEKASALIWVARGCDGIEHDFAALLADKPNPPAPSPDPALEASGTTQQLGFEATNDDVPF